jgi:predicted porin
MRRLAWLGAFVLLAPGLVRGVELETDVATGMFWNSNISNASNDENEEDDFNLDAAVRVGFRSDPRSQNLTWAVSYRPVYEKFIEHSDFDNLSHLVDGTIGYQLGPATTASLRGRFRQTDRTSRRLPGEDETDPGDPETTDGKQRVDRLETTMALSHRVTPRWTFSSNVNYDLTEYERKNRSDFWSIGGFGEMSYAVSRRHSLGGGVSLAHQDLQESTTNVTVLRPPPLPPARVPVESPGQTTNFGTLFAAWTYVVNPLWRVNLRAGPTYIKTDVDGGGSDSSFTGFALAGLSRQGEKSTLNLDVRRSQAENFGGRTSRIQTTVAGAFSWRPTQKWSTLFQATWSLRENATNAEDGADEKETDTYTVRVRATRKFTRNLSAFVIGAYHTQNTDGGSGTESDVDNIQAGIGLRYEFNPIQF